MNSHPYQVRGAFAGAVLFLLGLLLLAATFAAGAQDLPVATPVDPSTLVAAPPAAGPALPPTALIITVLVPLVIAMAKRLFPNLPGGAIPVLAPVIGAVLEYALQRVGVASVGLITGAVAGSGGVGLHQIVRQNSAKVTSDGVGLPPPAATALLLFGLLLLPGCAGFGSHQRDRSVVISPDGTREERDIVSRQRAQTFFDSKSALAQLRASQTDKTQSLGLGSLNQESTAPQIGQMLGVDLLLKLAATPEGKVALRAIGIPVP